MPNSNDRTKDHSKGHDSDRNEKGEFTKQHEQHSGGQKSGTQQGGHQGTSRQQGGDNNKR